MKNIETKFWRLDSIPSTSSNARKSSRSRIKLTIPLKKTISLGNNYPATSKMTSSLMVKSPNS